jgi:colicin import membrane protein
MIIKGERLPFSMNIVADDGKVSDYPGINWEEELSYSSAKGRTRRSGRQLRSSTKAKKAESRNLKQAERQLARAEKQEQRQDRRAAAKAERLKNRERRKKLNAEIKAERKLTREAAKAERLRKKEIAAKEKTEEKKKKAAELKIKAEQNKASQSEVSTAEWQAKVEQRKADDIAKKAESAEKEAEKKENIVLLQLQNDIEDVKAQKPREDLENQEEVNDGYLDEELDLNDDINKDNYEKISDDLKKAEGDDDKGLPWWAWALIGVGGLGVIGTIIYFVSKKSK